jgi:hypothetical protein
MSLPISSKIKRVRHKKDENVTKAKLPTQAKSKFMRKCPICKAPYNYICHNCNYVNHPAMTEELFRRGSEIDGNEDQYEGNE